MAKLEGWSIRESSIYTGSKYVAPELLQVVCLEGKVFGHHNPRFFDGDMVVTSSLAGRKGRSVIVTHSGTEYTLGRVDRKYGRRYPGARKRLFDSLFFSREDEDPCNPADLCGNLGEEEGLI